ncbi:hypothetical protein EEY24_14910 [Shewanella algae]|nr:hypothetical protein EEY24_14910 [Shewanella algae]
MTKAFTQLIVGVLVAAACKIRQAKVDGMTPNESERRYWLEYKTLANLTWPLQLSCIVLYIFYGIKQELTHPTVTYRLVGSDQVATNTTYSQLP